MREATLKLSSIIVIAAFLSSIATAPSAQQNHPLSEIYPIDEDLNMSDQEVFNASKISLNDGIGSTGLVLEGYTVSHEGGAQQFVLDYSNDEWDIENSDLNLNDNNISGFFDSSCATGMALNDIDSDGSFECISVTGEVSGSYVNITGDDLEGDINMQDYDILDAGEVDGVNLSDPGNAIQVSGNQYIVPSDSIDSDEIDSSAVTTSEISTGAVGSDEIEDSSVSNTDLSSNSVTYSAGDHLTGGGTVSLGGSTTIDLDDSSLGWTDLGISQSDITVDDLGSADADLNMNNYNIKNFYGSTCDSGYVVVDVQNDGTLDCINVSGEVQEAYVNRGGDTMTGNLDLNGNDLDDGTTIVWDASNSYIPQGRLENSELTVTAGDHLSSGGSVSLGNSVTLNVDDSSLGWSDLGISQSDVSANDVNLENVRNVDLNNAAGSYLGYNINNENFNVDASSVLSYGNDLDSNGDVSGLTDVNTDDLTEGSSNEYHTDERVEDAAASAITGSGPITVNYDDSNDEITVGSNAGNSGPVFPENITKNGYTLSYEVSNR